MTKGVPQAELFPVETVAALHRPRVPRPGSEAALLADLRLHPTVAVLDTSDRALLQAVAKHRHSLLAGNPPTDRCFMVCASAQGYLSFFLHVETEVKELWFRHPDVEAPFNHYVLDLHREDGAIIDPTGDQFNHLGADMPPVYLGPMPDVFQRWLVPPEPPPKKSPRSRRP